jgi:L-asparaginase II
MSLDLNHIKKSLPICVSVKRGNMQESFHAVDAVVMDKDGKVIQAFGDIESAVFPRSAIKFIQAIPFVESGAIEKYNLTERNISLACASHLGEKIHTDAVLDWLKTLGQNEEIFACGAHWPYDEETLHGMIRKSENPRKIHNNCSGKHCGMISTSLVKNENPVGYDKYDHPIQVRLRKILSELAGVDYDHAPWGIDGCGIPTYAIPLWATARSMAALLPDSSIAKQYANASRIILNAIVKEPLMISGTKGLCSNIVQATKGSILAKVGAEGVYTALIPSLGISILLKAHDGAGRASDTAVIYLLQKFGGLSESEINQLSPYYQFVMKNWAGLPVGEISVQL